MMMMMKKMMMMIEYTSYVWLLDFPIPF
jgi:hypothetical protein